MVNWLKPLWRRASCAAVAFLLGAGTGFAQDIGPERASGLLAEKNADITVLDVRTPGEFRQGHLRGARNINYFAPDFDQEVAGLDPDKPVLIYCRSGVRSASAVSTLEKAGIKKVYNLLGGILAWEGARLPVEK